MTLNLDDPEIRANAVRLMGGFAKYMQKTHGWTDEQRIEATKEFLRFEEKYPEKTLMSNLCKAFSCEKLDIENYLTGKKAMRRGCESVDTNPSEDKKIQSTRNPAVDFKDLTRNTISPETMQNFLKDNLSGDLTENALAIGMTEVTLDKLLAGTNQFVMPLSVRKICNFYGVSPDTINAEYSTGVESNKVKKARGKRRRPSALKVNFDQDHHLEYAIDVKGLGVYMTQLREKRSMSIDEMASKIYGFSEYIVQAHEEGNITAVFRPFLKAFCVGMDVKPEAIEEFCLRHAQAPTFVVNRRSSP